MIHVFINNFNFRALFKFEKETITDLSKSNRKKFFSKIAIHDVFRLKYTLPEAKYQS